MSDIPTFWNTKHPLSDKAQELFEQLVPDDGNCSTLQGELLRASTKINWDWFNNGWGCNNWSGAVVFLEKFFGELPVQPDITEHMAFLGALSYAREYSHGEPSPKNEDRADEVVTRIHETVVRAIMNNPEPIANTRDMWDFSEEDYREPFGSLFHGDDDDRYY